MIAVKTHNGKHESLLLCRAGKEKTAPFSASIHTHTETHLRLKIIFGLESLSTKQQKWHKYSGICFIIVLYTCFLELLSPSFGSGNNNNVYVFITTFLYSRISASTVICGP